MSARNARKAPTRTLSHRVHQPRRVFARSALVLRPAPARWVRNQRCLLGLPALQALRSALLRKCGSTPPKAPHHCASNSTAPICGKSFRSARLAQARWIASLVPRSAPTLPNTSRPARSKHPPNRREQGVAAGRFRDIAERARRQRLLGVAGFEDVGVRPNLPKQDGEPVTDNGMIIDDQELHGDKHLAPDGAADQGDDRRRARLGRS